MLLARARATKDLTPREAIKDLTPREASARDDLQIVDVRTDREWREGHIPGATHIPLDQLPGRLSELDRAKTVAFICHSGARSELATELAAGAGMEARNIDGGMLAWQRAGLPTTTK